MRIPRLHTGSGRISAAVMQQALDAGGMVAGRRGALEQAADNVTRAQFGLRWILARINSHSAISGQNNRWKYSFDQVSLDSTGAVSVVSGGFNESNTTHAWNLCELTNDGGTVADPYEAPGWDVNGAPAGFSLQPIRGKPVVLMFGSQDETGTFRWVFCLANVLDGECQ